MAELATGVAPEIAVGDYVEHQGYERPLRVLKVTPLENGEGALIALEVGPRDQLLTSTHSVRPLSEQKEER